MSEVGQNERRLETNLGPLRGCVRTVEFETSTPHIEIPEPPDMYQMLKIELGETIAALTAAMNRITELERGQR